MRKRTEYWREYFHRNRERILARQRAKRRKPGYTPPRRSAEKRQWGRRRTAYEEKVCKALGVNVVEARRWISEQDARQRRLRDKAGQSLD